MMALFRQQPRPFFMIFMLEIWERFGFYTVQGILVLYFVRSIGLSQHEAYAIFGTFSALIYGMVPLGGYLGDKLLGTKRTIVAGLMVLALGYALLSVGDPRSLYVALALICVGAALFKSNPGVLLAQSYTDKSALHAGFTLYYMAVNIGAIASLLVGPYVSSHYGYAYAYLISMIGILLGLLNYMLQYPLIKHIKTLADQRQMTILTWALLVVGIGLFVGASTFLLEHPLIARKIILLVAFVFVGFYFLCMGRVAHKERLRMVLAFVLMLEAVVFFTLYQQMPTSINVFAVNHVYPFLFGIPIDPQSFQVLNPFWIIVLSPVLALLYAYLNRQQVSFHVPYKFAVGMFFCGISFLVLYLSHFMANEQNIVSSWWLVLSYFFQALSELLVSALGIAMVAELVPPPIMGFVIGIWYLTSSVAGFTGAALASLTALPHGIESSVESLQRYSHVFLEIGVITVIAACFMGMIAPKLMRLIKEN